MMPDSIPFGARPDPAIAQLLRTYLEAPDDVAFTERLRQRLLQHEDSSWEVLARWARPGLAAAACLALLVGAWLEIRRDAADAPAYEETIQPTGAPAQLFATSGPVTGDVVLAAVMDGE